MVFAPLIMSGARKTAMATEGDIQRFQIVILFTTPESPRAL